MRIIGGLILGIIIVFCLPVRTFANSGGFVFPTSATGTNYWSISNYLGESWYSKASDKWLRGHLGEDLVNSAGTIVYGAGNGIVTKVLGWPKCTMTKTVCDKENICTEVKLTNHGWGPTVMIKHEQDDGTYSVNDDVYLKGSEIDSNPTIVYSKYGHLDNVDNLQVGKKIKIGEKIGEVGKICNWIPHLHFEIIDEEGYTHDITKSAGAGFGYSGTDNYAPHRYKPSEFIELNKDLIIDDGIQEEIEVAIEKSPTFFQKVKNFFNNIFSSDTKSVQTEGEQQVLGEQIEDVEEEVVEIVEEEVVPVYNAVFLPQNIGVNVLEEETEASVTMTIKNISNVEWNAGTVSLNVVGGWEKNKVWNHAGWATKLRPVVIGKNVPADTTVSVAFPISLPETISTPLLLQLVRQEGTSFLQIGNSFASVEVEHVLEKVVEKEIVKEEVVSESEKTIIEQIEEITDVLGEKIVDVVNKIIDSVPTFSFGGGGGSSGSSNVPVEEPLPVDVPAITLDTVIDADIFLNTSTIFLSGEKNEVTTDIVVSLASSSVSFPSSTSWEADATLVEGENSVRLTPVDSGEVEGESIEFQISVDTIAPEITSFVAEKSTPTSTDIVLTWAGEDETSGVASYEIEVQTDGGEFESFFSSTSTTSTLFSGEPPHVYAFRIRATDNAGNISEWQESESSVSLDWEKSVVINELAWGGTADAPTKSRDCTKHEWIELKNTTTSTIDLAGWNLEFATPFGTTSSFALSGTISPGSYILLAKKEKGYVALTSIPIGQEYENIELDNDGMNLTLVNDLGETIDEVIFANNWPAGVLGKSMERVDAIGSGSSPTNWSTAEHISARGGTNGCGTLYGSPAQPNGKLWLLKKLFENYTEHIDDTGTLTLTAEHSPYVLDNETVVPEGNTLVVEPGVTLIGKTNIATLVVKGDAQFLGTDTDHVQITSARDATDGTWQMDALGTGTPVAGDWSHIHVLPGGSLDMQYTDIAYGGQPFLSSGGFVFGGNDQAQVLRTEGVTSLAYSSIVNSYVHPNTKYLPYNADIWIAGGTLSVTDSIFDKGYSAIKNESNTTGNVTIERNIFRNSSSTEGTIVLEDIWPVSVDNTFENNSGPDIVIPRYTFQKNTVIPEASTIVAQYLTIPEEITLEMNAGSTLGLKSGGIIDVYGSLQTHGTPDSPVFIKNVSGQWGRMTFYEDSSGEFSHTRISGGGANIKGESIMVDLVNANVDFEYTEIKDGRNPGTLIRLRDSDTSFLACTIGFDALPAGSTTGIDVRGGVTTLDDVFLTYLTYGITGDTDTSVSANNMSVENFVEIKTNNWWPISLMDFAGDETPESASSTSIEEGEGAAT